MFLRLQPNYIKQNHDPMPSAWGPLMVLGAGLWIKYDQVKSLEDVRTM